MSWEELVERSMPSKDDYGQYMSWLYEEMKKVNNGVLSLDEFERIIQEPGFDIEGYIISKNITNQQEEEITARLGSKWKRNLWVKWMRFKLYGDWDTSFTKTIKEIEKDIQ